MSFTTKSKLLSLFEEDNTQRTDESTFLNSSTVPTYEEFTKKSAKSPFTNRYLSSTQGLSRLSIFTDDESDEETYVKSPKNSVINQIKNSEIFRTINKKDDSIPLNNTKQKTFLTPILEKNSRTPVLIRSPVRTPRTMKKVSVDDSGDEYGFFSNKQIQTSFASTIDLELENKSDDEKIIEDSLIVLEPDKKAKSCADFGSYRDNTKSFNLRLSSSSGTNQSESDTNSKKDSVSPTFRPPPLNIIDINVTQRKKISNRVSIKSNKNANNSKKRVSICGQALNDDVFNIDDTVIDQFDNELDHKKGLLCSILERNDEENCFDGSNQQKSIFSSTKLAIESCVEKKTGKNENKFNQKENSSSDNDDAFEKFLNEHRPGKKTKEPSSSDNDDAFEKFLNQHRPKESNIKPASKADLKDFIVDDTEYSEDEPIENENIKKKPNRKQNESRVKKSSYFSSSDNSDDQEYDEQYDRDLQLFYIKTTNSLNKKDFNEKPKSNNKFEKDDSIIKLDDSLSNEIEESDSSLSPFKNSSSDSDIDDSFSRIFRNKTSIKPFDDHTFKTPKRNPNKFDQDLRLVKTSFVPRNKEPIKKLSFIESLSKNLENDELRDPSVSSFFKKFHIKSVRQELLNECYRLFNKYAFDNQLPIDMKLVWSDKITSTAGYCKYSSRDLSCEIHISTKVCSDPERLRDTLAHEMCHAAAFLISRCNDNHGPIWKSWTRKVNFAFKKIPKITVTHSYSVTKKFIFRCTKCHLEIHRFSKSINIEKEVCGICHGRFEVIKNSAKNALEINKLRQERMDERFDEIRSELHGIQFTPKRSNQIDNKLLTPRQPNKFALFVKENYGSVKKEKNLTNHKDVMQELSKNFKTLSTK